MTLASARSRTALLPSPKKPGFDGVVLEALADAGCTIIQQEPTEYWRHWDELCNDDFSQPYPHMDEIRGKEVTLGFLGGSHLGDVLCVSALVRPLVQVHGCRVRMVRYRGTYKVFEHNPYLNGFQNGGRIALSPHARGPGHIIQKLQRAFGLPMLPFPRGELYLSDDKLRWAWDLRKSLPRNRPIAVVCSGSLSDNRFVPAGSLGWQEYVDTIVACGGVVLQLAATRVSTIEEVTRIEPGHRQAWKPDTILENCYVLEDLPPRQYFAAISIADLFMGTNTGGTHVAAAFDVPSLVVLGRQQYRRAITFPDRLHGNHWNHESFLYPQHAFLLR